MRWIRAIAATLVLAVLVLGVPLLLLVTVGNPAGGVHDLISGDVSDHAVLDVLAIITYGAAVVAWLQFTLAFAVEFASGLRRTPVPRRIPVVFAGQQRLARALVTAALLLGPTLLSAAGPTLTAAAATPPPAAAQVLVGRHDWTPTTRAVTPRVTALLATPAGTAVTAVTVHGDGPRTWWDLAQEHLGAGDRWQELWTLNEGGQQSDGTVMTTPASLLREGWKITIPAPPPAQRDTTDHDTRRPDLLIVTVQPGDSLASVAKAHGVNWTALWEINHDRPQPGGRLFSDPNYLMPGWTVLVPTGPQAATTGAAVTVAPGDNLSQIAATHGSTTAALWQANQNRPEPGGARYTDPDLLEPGWVIQIPASPLGPPAATPHRTEPHFVAGPGAAAKAAAAQRSTAAHRAADDHAAAEESAARLAAPKAAAAAAAWDAAERKTAANAVAAQRAADQQTAAAQAAAGQVAEHKLPDQQTPAAPSRAQHAPATTSTSQVSMVAAGAGAVLLTALGLAALLRLRRRQLRWRRPGRAIAATPPQLSAIQRTLLSTGGRGTADVTWLDGALRSLVQNLSTVPGAQLPDVVAVRLGTDELQLMLSAPLNLALAPWSVDERALRWTVQRGQELPYDQAQREFHMPPYPLLVSVGYTPAGDHYLIDLERIGSLSLSGDRDRCLNLARFIAAEIAHNTWSELLEVSMVGFGAEMARMNPAQLRYSPDLAGVLTSVRSHLTGVHEVMTQTDVDVSTGRLRCIAGDTWAPHLLLIAPEVANADQAGLAELLTVLEQTRDRQTVAVVLIDSGDAAAPVEATRWHLQVDSDGVLQIPALELELVAEQLPESEAGALTQLLAAVAQTHDEPMPTADGDALWDGFADAAGNLRPQVTSAVVVPALRVAGSWPVRPNSILPLPPAEYAARTATTEEDVAVLAPGVSDQVQAELADADPELDADLAAWWDGDSARVKLRLLGPLDVWSAVLEARPVGRPQKIEAVAYLATRVRGASASQTREDLWPEDSGDRPTSKVRNLMLGTRSWLGVDPVTERDCLPVNAGESRGGLYRIQGILIDAELFRRLRLRALTRGPQGVGDLRAALDLVAGVPFEQRRPRGYGWVADTALDHTYTAMVTDAAHILATHHLAAGEPEQAAAAAQVALTAGSTADSVLLDLVAACHARGDSVGGDGYVKTIMRNHDAEVEEEIPPRTYDILLRHRWLPTARTA